MTIAHRIEVLKNNTKIIIYICFNKSKFPILNSNISYITKYGTVFHSFENSNFKEPLLGELILENVTTNNFTIIFYKNFAYMHYKMKEIF